VGRRLLLVLTLAAALAAPAQARAAIPLSPCGATGVQCGTVNVPLDRSGQVPGTIALHVQVLAPNTLARGTMFLIAGGPGQGSAESFDLANRDNADIYRAIFPGYQLVAFDNRGTGQSGLIDCPALQRAIGLSVEQERGLVRECATSIGPSREFYATRDHAEDLESVRVALGLGKVALYGVSYGTKLSLAYALAHPSSVDRLVLDSVVPPTYPDPFERAVLTQMAGTLDTFCAGGRCRGATSNYSADVAAVANRFEAKRAEGTVRTAAGGKKVVRMTGEDVLSLIIDSDLSPGLAAELPAAIHAARGGYVKPLLRLFDMDNRASSFPSEDLSFGLNVATNCADGLFPWSPATPVDQRQSIWDAAVAAEPASSFGPFGKWAARTGTAAECLEWPSPAGRTPLGPGPFPNVPVLLLDGGYDLRTPVANALQVAQQFPRSQVVVVPGVGHSVVGADLSFCAPRAVREWILGQLFGTRIECPRVTPPVKTLTAFPKAASRTPQTTAALVAKTVREGQASWLQVLFSGASFQPPGLYGGKVVSRGANGFTLGKYAVAPGVVVSGKLNARFTGSTFVVSGSVRISGPKAVGGTLRVTAGKLSGTLAGRRVSAAA